MTPSTLDPRPSSSAQPLPPALTPCPDCRSLYCGPVRCRFTMQERYPVKVKA